MKSIELKDFIDHNKELFESDDFKMIFKMKKLDDDISESDKKEYKIHKEMWEEIVFNKVKELLNNKLEIIYL